MPWFRARRRFEDCSDHVSNRHRARETFLLHTLCLCFFSRSSSTSWFPLFAFFLPFVPSPHHPMPANRESPLRQPPFPPLARADRRRLVEQAVFFLLPGQPGEFGHQRVPGRKERFLAVADGEIGARCVVEAVELARPERELDAAEQGRVRVGLEVGTDQVRDLPRMPVQLDQVRPLDLAETRAGAALVHPEQRLERIAVVARYNIWVTG